MFRFRRQLVSSMLWIFFVLFCYSKGCTSTNEKQVRLDGIVPEDYKKYEPPWTKDQATEVYVTFYVMDVDRIDEGDMDFNIQTYILDFWKDQRLNLSAFVGKDGDARLFPASLVKAIWVPDMIFDNTKKGLIFPLSVPNTVMRVRPDGMFQRSTRYSLVVNCHMEFQFYPMDTQYCSVIVNTLGSSDNQVKLKWVEEYDKDLENIHLMTDIQPLEYVIMQPETHTTTEIWTSGNYTYLYANFTFVRRLSGTVFNVYIPSILVVSLSWISFWIDVSAVPARITLGVTSLLTLATQIVQAKKGLPTISYLTAVDVWLLACLMMVFSSLIEFAFAYQLKIRSRKKAEKNKHANAKSTPSQNVEQRFETAPRSADHSTKQPNDLTHGVVLDIACRKLFPFVFGVFSAIYWSYYLKNR